MPSPSLTVNGKLTLGFAVADAIVDVVAAVKGRGNDDAMIGEFVDRIIAVVDAVTVVVAADVGRKDNCELDPTVAGIVVVVVVVPVVAVVVVVVVVVVGGGGGISVLMMSMLLSVCDKFDSIVSVAIKGELTSVAVFVTVSLLFFLCFFFV